MDDDYTTPTRRGAPLIQAALALLVASTLVAFSVLAFRLGFGTERGRDVTATDASGTGAAVVLPSFEGEEEAAAAPTQPNGEGTRIAIAGAPDELVVLGTRVATASAAPQDADTHEQSRGRGHDKARGRGHHKDGPDKRGGGWRGDDHQVSAREEDDSADDHGDDDSNDESSDDSDRSGSGSDASRSGPGHRKQRGGGHNGSRGHSGNSNSN